MKSLKVYKKAREEFDCEVQKHTSPDVRANFNNSNESVNSGVCGSDECTSDINAG